MGAHNVEGLLAASRAVEQTPRERLLEGVLVGHLIGFTNDGTAPLVTYVGQPGTAAIAARSVAELHGVHIGRQVVLVFEQADPMRPIIMGCLQTLATWPLEDRPAQLEVDADGERLILSAKNELVLHCGQASLTLTRAGKVVIKGTYLLSRSLGVNRIKGGSVQIN